MKSEKILKPKGYYIFLGTILGLPFGIALSLALNNLAFAGIGVGIGLPIGVALEEQAKKEGRLRDTTPKEDQLRKRLVWGIVFFGVLIFLLVIGAIIWKVSFT